MLISENIYFTKLIDWDWKGNFKRPVGSPVYQA